VLILSTREKEMRIDLPVIVCTRHKQSLRRLFTGRGLRQLGERLFRRGVTLARHTARVEFKHLL
jgi:hypothetical protein